MTPIDINFTEADQDVANSKSRVESRNSKKTLEKSHLATSDRKINQSPSNKNNKKEEKFQMPECLKELIDYKNSEDFQLFKQLHKSSLRMSQKKRLMPRSTRPNTAANPGGVAFGRRRT